MPLFEYNCRACRRQFEYLKITSTDEVVTCPHCGGKEVSKLLSASSARIGHGASAPTREPGSCAGRSGFS